jgi:hypothetical protein
VDRLRAASTLDARSWPEVAAELGTTHQRLYHLTSAEGPAQRRCRQDLRDGFATLFAVLPEWLSGTTDALPYVVSADATAVALPFPRGREAHTRLSAFRGTGRPLPGLQLSLDRLLADADRALERDLSAAGPIEGFDPSLVRPYALFLVAGCAEVGLDLIHPLPPIEAADALRISAARHAAEALSPWLKGTGPYPDWNLLHQLGKRAEHDTRGGSMLMIFEALGQHEVLVATYARLPAQGQTR